MEQVKRWQSGSRMNAVQPKKAYFALLLNVYLRWFKSPIFPDDEDKTRMAKILYALLGNFLLFLIFAILGTIFIFVNKLLSGTIIFILLSGILALYVLAKRGHVLIASKLFVWGLWIIFSLSILFTGRFNTTFVSVLLATTVMAGVLLGKRSAILFAVLSFLVGLTLVTLENSNYHLVHYFPVPPATGLFVWTLAFILVLTPLTPTMQRVLQSTETLQRKQHFIESVLAATPDIVHIYDLQERRTVFSSRSILAALGYTSEEVETMGRNALQQLLHPEDYARLPELYGRWDTAKDGDVLISEYRMRAKSGEWLWFAGRDMPFQRGLDGKVQQFIGTVFDITDRKQAEAKEYDQRMLAEALNDSAAALNSTLKFQDVLLSVLDNVGKVVPHDASNIMTRDAGGDTFSVAYHRGYVERGLKLEEIERQFSLETIPSLMEAARTGKCLGVPNIKADSIWASYSAIKWVGSYIIVPIQIRQDIVGFLTLHSEAANFFTADHAERLQAFANHAAIAIQNAQLFEDMKTMAVMDSLTGIYNRAFFETELSRLEHSRDFPVTIIVADLDNLKIVNDDYGHVAGDTLLKNSAQILKNTFRAADIIARIGGDEFCMLLPNTDSETASQMLSRVREKLDEYNVTHPDLPVGLSFGTATAKNGNLLEIFKTADQRMYADKAKRKSSE